MKNLMRTMAGLVLLTKTSFASTTRNASVISWTLLVLAITPVLAQDNSSRTISINGGSETVYMGTRRGGQKAHGATCIGFYDNICAAGYQANVGWTVSDGVPPNSEWSPANQFTSWATGLTHRITVGVGRVQGTGEAYIDLVSDCGNTPCTDPDGNPADYVLCSGVVTGLDRFGGPEKPQSKSFHCQAFLTQGTSYWVLMQSPANTWLGWNLSNAANGLDFEGENDVWVNNGNQTTGALTVF